MSKIDITDQYPCRFCKKPAFRVCYIGGDLACNKCFEDHCAKMIDMAKKKTLK